MPRKAPPDYSHLVRSLVADSQKAYRTFNKRATFGGPSLYFHERALEAAGQGPDEFAQAAYGMLVSWGMHRMGKGGAKMGDFALFRSSIHHHWEEIADLRRKSPETLTDSDWESLRNSFLGIKAMATKAVLVANSKVLAHALPELVAPIDRNYTLRFLFKSTSVKNEPEDQWRVFQELHKSFFYPVAASLVFQRQAKKWIQERSRLRWNSSVLKLVDNCVIGLTPKRAKS